MDYTGSELYTPPIGGMHTVGTGKLLNMIFVVDVSGSMKAEKRIDAVNEAFQKMIPALREIQMDSLSEFELKIAIMTFDQEARWIVNPTPILEYNHNDIDCSQWVTYFSRAFEKLGEKLTRSEFMAHTGKLAQPYIMFMTDGEPTPDDNYGPKLDELLGNGWFNAAQRFAVLMGKDAINSPAARKAVERFVSDPTEGIINAADAAAIAAEVQAKTIHTIQIATKHIVATGEGEGEGQSSNTGTGESGGAGGMSPWDEPDWPDFGADSGVFF